MEHIYAQSEDKWVKTTVLYGKSGDNYLYVDASCTDKKELTKEVVLDILMKGTKVLYGGVYYTPLNFKDNATNVSVTIGTPSADTTLYSNEYSA